MSDLHLLTIEIENGGQRQSIAPVLLQDERDVVLVDCGYPDSMEKLEAAAGRYGLSLGSITKLIVTHHDLDHIGSLAALKEAYPHIAVIAHEREVPYVQGIKKSLRLQQAESTLADLPDELKPGAEQFIRSLASVEPAVVDQIVSHGEKLPWCGGIEVVHTPGHMPGHISLYLPGSKTLIAGDAVVYENGQLDIANPHFALDLKEAVRSVQRLLAYDIEQIVCYHGGWFRGDVQKELCRLIDSYQERSGEAR